MPTNNFIESSFWNFDSLFQPQQHPARDQHDTFFLSGEPSCACHTCSSIRVICERPLKTSSFRPGARPRVPTRLPGESEEGPLRGRLRLTRVRHDHQPVESLHLASFCHEHDPTSCCVSGTNMTGRSRRQRRTSSALTLQQSAHACCISWRNR